MESHIQPGIEPATSIPEAPGIPADLQRRLETLKPVLQKAGSVIARREGDRQPSFRIRCRVGDAESARRRLSIDAGGERVAEAVGQLIGRWQDEYRTEQRRRRRLDRIQRRHQRGQRAVLKEARRLLTHVGTDPHLTAILESAFEIALGASGYVLVPTALLLDAPTPKPMHQGLPKPHRDVKSSLMQV